MEAGAFAPMAVQLRDGRRVVLRQIGPQDKDPLQAAVQALSASSRYSRFMTSVRELSPQTLESATHPEPGQEFALVAVFDDGSGESIVGGARYGAARGGEECEFAVTVLDDWQRLGLARRLMETLMQEARARGFRRMEGYILASNKSMRALAKRLGFKDSQTPGDPTCRTVRCGLDGAA